MHMETLETPLWSPTLPQGRKADTHTDEKQKKSLFILFLWSKRNDNEDQPWATKQQSESWKAVEWWEWGLFWVFLVIMDVEARRHLTTPFDDCSSDRRLLDPDRHVMWTILMLRCIPTQPWIYRHGHFSFVAACVNTKLFWKLLCLFLLALYCSEANWGRWMLKVVFMGEGLSHNTFSHSELEKSCLFLQQNKYKDGISPSMNAAHWWKGWRWDTLLKLRLYLLQHSGSTSLALWIRCSLSLIFFFCKHVTILPSNRRLRQEIKRLLRMSN